MSEIKKALPTDETQAPEKKVRTWTEEQKRAIRTTDRTLLLSAAAGSGKTATLTERLARMITDPEHPLDVSRMLIVTFTRAAAAELRERIADALSAAIERDPENPHLARQSLLLPSAKIRTIDSFCNDLVKGHTETLDIPPNYRIPDESENAVLAAGLMEQLVEDAYNGLYCPTGAGIARVSECTVGAKNERDLAELLLSFYTKLQGYPDGVGLLTRQVEQLREQRDKPFFDTLWGDYVREQTRRCLSDLLEGYRSAVWEAEMADGKDSLIFQSLGEAFASDIAFLKGALVGLSDGYEATRLRLASFSSPKAGKRASNDKLSEESLRVKRYRDFNKAELKDLQVKLYAWREADIPAAFDETAEVTETVAALLLEFHTRYAREKRRLCLCDYNDLEHFALTLLDDGNGGKTPLAEQLTDSFDAICIDEYQDVNEVQHRIFTRISTPTNRFMVGDIKQSIYGFRGAQPEIFATLRRDYVTDDRTDEKGQPLPAVYYLSANFRSEPCLLDFCNGVFDYLFGVMGKSIGYTEADRLSPGREPLLSARPSLSILPKKGDAEPSEEDETEDEDEEAVSVEEVSEVVSRIRRVLSEERRADGRPYCPADIAILLRGGKKKISQYVAALQEAGIPVCTEDKQNFFTHPEILLALCLCHTVNNPRRDVYLAGLLRSPLYGFTMDDLVTLRRESGEGCLYDALVAHAAAHPEDEACHVFLSELAAFREVAEGMSTERLLRLLFEKTGLFSVVDAKGRRLLFSLYEFARQYEAASYHGLYRFLSHVEKLIAEERSVGGGRMVGAQDGVQIVTVHHSKGLEYPVCFFCGIGGQFSHKDYTAPMIFDPKLGLGLCLRDKETGLARMKTPIYRAIAAALKQASREEEARVLYVALTRPRERLYLYGTAGKKLDALLTEGDLAHTYPSVTGLLRQNSYLAWILSAIGTTSPLCDVTVLENAASAPAEKEAACASPTEEAALPNGEEREAEIEAYKALFRARFAETYPYAAATELPGKLSVSLLHPAYLDEQEEGMLTHLPEKGEDAPPTPTVPAFISGVEKNAAALAGTATHVFLQFCRYEEVAAYPSAEAAVDAELARMVKEGFLPAEEAARVRRREAAAFLRSPLLARIVSAREVHRELRFHTMLPASAFTQEKQEKYAGYEIFVQGVIDLVFVDAEGRLVLLDYKTDRLTEDELADPDRASAALIERHGAQLRYYGMAVEDIFGRRPDEVLIYSLHAARAFPVKQCLL